MTKAITFISRNENQELNKFSAVLFTKANNSIHSISDLTGKTLVAVNEEAFGGFQLAQFELLKHGINVNTDMDVLWLGFPHVDLVKAVLDGQADVAIARSGVLE